MKASINYHKEVYQKLEKLLELKLKQCESLEAETYELQIELINYEKAIRRAANNDLMFESKFINELNDDIKPSFLGGRTNE